MEDIIKKILLNLDNDQTDLGASGCKHFETGYQNKQLWFKIGKNDPIFFENGFRVETQLYENVLQNMRHIPVWYGNYNIDNNLVLAIEKINGYTCYDIFKTLSFIDILNIITQVILTLLYFQQLNLQHNDLHLHNILLENKSNTVLNYDFKNINIKITTNYIVKIIDFDRASIYHDKVERNFNQYIRNNSKEYDIYTFLSAIWKGANKEINLWMEKEVPEFVDSLPKNSFFYIQDHIKPEKYISGERVLYSLKKLNPIIQIQDEIILDKRKSPFGDTGNLDLDYDIYKSIKQEYFDIILELFSHDYNWMKEADTIHKKCLDLEEYKNVNSKKLIEACLSFTNPIRLKKKNKLEKSMEKYFKLKLILPQKYTENINEKWS